MSTQEEFPKLVRAVDVVNNIFGSGLFMLPNGRTTYDEVWMSDGGRALYLRKLVPDDNNYFGYRIVVRWIDWDATLLQMYPLE